MVVSDLTSDKPPMAVPSAPMPSRAGGRAEELSGLEAPLRPGR